MPWHAAALLALIFAPIKGGLSCGMPATDRDPASDAAPASDAQGPVAVDAGAGGADAVPPSDAAAPPVDSGPTCLHECALGARTCIPSGAEARECVAGADGCYRWQTAEVCGPRQGCPVDRCECQGGGCTPGQVRCGAGGGLQTCDGPDADGCTGWGAEVACPTGLVCNATLLQCKPDTPTACFPINECDYDGQVWCTSSAKYRQCVYAPDGCLEWDCES